jgi:tRNA threonylcarbamoyladenosine biosynthesis protein TsaE
MGAERVFLSTSEEATEALGEALGRVLPAGTVLALGGELGAGKTCLVRGLARGLGIEGTVASPTYTLMQAHGGGRLPLYHFDAWMEGREKAWLAEGGEAWLRGEGLAVIEWAERVGDWLPSPRLELRLEHRSPNERAIFLSVVGDGGMEQALSACLAGMGTPEGLISRDAALGDSDQNQRPG